MKKLLIVVGLLGLAAKSTPAETFEQQIREISRAASYSAREMRQAREFDRAEAGARSEALSGVLKRVKQEARAGRVPVVVFDIDDTLFDSSHRDVRIMRELAQDAEFKRQFPQAAETLAKVGVADSQGRYNVVDVAKALGIEDQAALDAIKAYWLPRFFSNEYVVADQPVAGAADYAAALERKGAVIVYLTGRDSGRMRMGTEISLREHGFPLPDGRQVILLMKEDKSEKDAAYKDRVLSEVVDKIGPVVASFENEPKNLNIFAQRYPGALLVFLNTKHSPAPDEPDARAARVQDFQR